MQGKGFRGIIIQALLFDEVEEENLGYLKILMLTSSYPKFPGDVTAPFIEAIAQHTQQLGHEVTVLMPYNPELRRKPVENGVRLYQYHYAPLPSWNIWGYAASLEGDVKIRGLVYLLLPFVLISSFWQMWKLTRRERFDLIQAHWVIPNAPVAILVGLLRRIPVVISLHGSDVYVAEKLWFARLAARWAFRRAAGVTASSENLLQRAQRLGAPLDSEKAAVIPYGADPAIFSTPSTPRPQLREKMGLPQNQPVLFCIGRLVYKKGFEYAIRAMPAVLEKYPGARLVIGGKGDLRAELEREAKLAGVTGKVRFEGSIPHHKVPEYLAASDIFLLPSVVDHNGNVDGLPNTLMEALAAGKAVVASNIAGVPLAVTDRFNGRVVPERDEKALASAICELLDNPELRERYGQAGRRRVEQEMNWTKIAGRYEKVFLAATPNVKVKVEQREEIKC